MDLERERSGLIRRLRQEIADERVLAAMARVPREYFVPCPSRHLAYADVPLPIGQGQTISQPFMVALMSQALRLTGRERVLEVGTGSGYQAAVLSHLARTVITVERHLSLAVQAQRLLQDLGCTNVEVYVAGEELGWREGEPYDAILVTAAAPCVPQALLDQLVDGGYLVLPVGSRLEQELVRVTKHEDCIRRENLGGCRFVPLVGKQAWEEG